jgi:hypothetical protein
MVHRFGQLLVEAMFDAGISSYSELLECLLAAGAEPKEANVDTLITAITSARLDAHPAFSPDFWCVLALPDVLSLTEETEKALMLAYASKSTRRHINLLSGT